MKLLSHARHIVWDWNGTLLDDVALCLEILNEELVRYGLEPASIDESRERMCFPIRKMYENHGLHPHIADHLELSARFMKHYSARLAEARLRPGAREVLEEIQRSGRTQS